MPVVGVAEVLVKPIFSGAQREIARGMDSAADRAGRSAGGKAGRGFGRGFAPAIAMVAAGLAVIPPAAGAASASLLAAGGSAVTLATSLSSLGGIAALVPAGLMSITAGAGTLITAFSGMGEALKTAVDAGNAVSTINPRLAAMAIEDAMQAISDAEANAADVRESSARRVADAKRSLAEAVEAAAEAQVAAAKAVEMAERSESRAARDVIKAQKDLVKAREEAVEKLNRVGESLEAANRRAIESAEAYRKAAALYEAAKADPRTRINELAQLERNATVAAANDKAAKQSVVELRDLHAKAYAESEDAREKVLDAEQRLTDAQQAQIDAVRDRKDAQADVLKQEKDGAQQIADAQQAVTDATKDSAKAQLDAARAITDAHRNLERVQLQQADSGSAASKKAAAAMDNLTPSAREAALALLAVKDQLGGIRRIAQENFFKGFAAPLLSLAGSVMPQLATGVGAIASAMGAGARTFMGSLESSLGGGVLESLLMGVAKSTEILNKAISPVVESFTTLGVVGMPYMARLSQFIVVISDRFNNFIQTTAADGRLVAWIDGGIQTLKDLWSIAGDIIGVFGSINKAAEAGGLGSTVSGLAAGMSRLDELMKGETFQTTMTTIFGGAAKGADGLKESLDNIAGAFVRGAPALAEFMRLGGEIAGTFIGGIFDAFSNPEFGAGLVTFMEGLQGGAEAVAPLLPGMFAALGSVLAAMAPIAEVMGPAMVIVLTNLATGLAAVISFIAPLLTYFASSPTFMTAMTIGLGLLVVAWKLLGVQALIAGGKMALAWLLGMGPVGLIIGAVIALVALIIYNWDTIVAVTKDLWEKGVKPIFDTLCNFITKDVPKAFEDGVKWIGEAWANLQKLARDPVKFVVDTVINDGLINGLNTIGGFLGLGKIPRLALPAGFADGGYTGPGGKYQPAGIVHAGEIVWSQDDIARWGGVGIVESLRKAAGFALGGLVNPLRNAVVSQPFSGAHNGMDFAAPVGTPIGAAGPGRVSSAGWSAHGGGNELHIDHPNGLQTWYAHLSSFAVKLGDMVRGGQKIGEVGSTGNSTGPHLHYMVMNGGWPNYVNPSAYLDGGGDAGKGGWNPIADIIDGLLSKFKSAFPAAGFMADMAIGAGKKILDGAVDFITGNGGKDKGIGSTGLPYLHDQGGVLPPGLSSIVNATRKPEAILNAQQWADIHRLATQGGGGRGDVIFKGNVGWDPNEVAHRIETKRRDTFAAFGI
jgi:hypothetical protein